MFFQFIKNLLLNKERKLVLLFINNMNHMGNDEAVNAMTQKLAEYFKYTTRINDPLTTLEKEIGVVRNYLNIQSLRISRNP